MQPTAGDNVAFIRQIIAQSMEGHQPVEGLVVPGSWDPAQKTVHVQVGHTLTLIKDENGDQVINHQPVPLLTPFVGLHGGPVGNERCIIIPFMGGVAAILFAGSERQPEPSVPSGELHGYYRNADGTVQRERFAKIQQDATRLGHDQAVIVESPQHLVGMETSADDNAVVRKKDLQRAIDDALSAVHQAMQQGYSACQPGSGVPTPQIQQVTTQASQTSYTK